MTLLRNALQTALHDVVLACGEAADGHEAAAEILAGHPLAEVLRQLADERRELAGRLGERLRELDDLPPEPDADLETVRELATWVKAALTGDQRHTVLHERKAAEAHLEATAEEALAQPDLSPDTRALLEQIRADAHAAQQRLAALAADAE
ncbi:MAG TPA: DUF2383 domain-containing protein [Geminicoccaceae bacterium]